MLFSPPALCYGREAEGETSISGLPHVIIVTLAGVRNCETIEDQTHQYIPHLWNEMFKEGTLYTNLVNVNYEFHMPAVRAINDGHKHFSWFMKGGKLYAPTIFQLVRNKYHLPANKVWSLGCWDYADAALRQGKFKENTFPCQFKSRGLPISGRIREVLKGLLNKQDTDFLDNYQLAAERIGVWTVWDSFEPMQYRIFKKIMTAFKPVLVHYVSNATEIAHGGSYAQYVLALKEVDKKIFEIWQMIQNDKEYKDKTYLFVDVDHERDDYFKTHHMNPNEDNPSRVWMFVYGPGVKKDQVIERPVYHRDIFATVASLMKVEAGSTEGRVLKDCLEESQASSLITEKPAAKHGE